MTLALLPLEEAPAQFYKRNIIRAKTPEAVQQSTLILPLLKTLSLISIFAAAKMTGTREWPTGRSAFIEDLC